MALVESKETKDTSLADIIAENFSGHQIRVDSKTGYLCVSDICKAADSEWSRYSKLEGSKSFIKELSSALRIGRALLIKTNISGAYEIRGTWAHSRIALHMCFTKFPKFAMFVMDIVERFASGDLTLAEEVISRHDSINDTNTQFTSRSDVNTNRRITHADTISNDVLKADPKKAAIRQKSFKRLEFKYNRLVLDHKDTKLQLDEATITVFDQADQLDEMMVTLNRQSADIQKLLGFATETKETLGRTEKTLGETKETLGRTEKTLGETKESLGRTEKTLGETKEVVTKISSKLSRAIPNRVVYSGVSKNQLESTHVYRHDNFVYGIEFEYHMFRCQKRSLMGCVKNRIRTLWRQRRESGGNPDSRPAVPILEEIDLEKYFDNHPNPVMFWTRFAEHMERIGAIELNPANKMQFSMIVEEDDFKEELYWFDLERGIDLE